jgi:hypothetical protein
MRKTRTNIYFYFIHTKQKMAFRTIFSYKLIYLYIQNLKNHLNARKIHSRKLFVFQE